MHHAQCCCQQLNAAIDGEPTRVSICHCLECQRRTGSVFAAQARFLREHVKVSGNTQIYRRKGDDGGEVEFHFCPDCGSTVFYYCADEPELIAITVGSLAEPNFPQPNHSFYELRKHHWVEVPTGTERFD